MDRHALSLVAYPLGTVLRLTNFVLTPKVNGPRSSGWKQELYLPSVPQHKFQWESPHHSFDKTKLNLEKATRQYQGGHYIAETNKKRARSQFGAAIFIFYRR